MGTTRGLSSLITAAGAPGEALAVLLRAGNAGSNTAAGHRCAKDAGLRRLPRQGPGHPDHRCDHPPASPRARLTSTKPPMARQEQPQSPRNTAHPARQPGRHARPGTDEALSRRARPPGHQATIRANRTCILFDQVGPFPQRDLRRVIARHHADALGPVDDAISQLNRQDSREVG